MTLRGRVLVVEDEEYVRDSLATWLERRGFGVVAAASLEDALVDKGHEGVDLVLTDLKLPGEDGLAVVRRFAPTLPVVVLTGHGSVDSAVDCMKAGAADYLRKPIDPEELVLVVERSLGRERLRREVDYLRSGGAGRDGAAAAPVGESAAWRRVLELVDVAAPFDTSVLLLGESGVGKEVVARLIHGKSQRADGPFVSVNCAAVPSELFESEFFGHRRGAFTGAVADRDGRFQVAHGGTLFLDEIDSLPPMGQAKILRVLQDGVFERVGESRPTAVDVRVVCATNTDLAAAVEAGVFRADLYYRIDVMTIPIPPLRERPEDVPPLAETFLAEMAARFGKPVRRLAPAVLDAFTRYPWPGNVRELRNVVERATLLAQGEEVGLDCLPFTLSAAGGAGGAAVGDGGGSEAGDAPLHLRASLLRTEKRLLEEALERSGGVRRQAARLLGIDERNLSYFLKKHDLQ